MLSIFCSCSSFTIFNSIQIDRHTKERCWYTHIWSIAYECVRWLEPHSIWKCMCMFFYTDRDHSIDFSNSILNHQNVCKKNQQTLTKYESKKNMKRRIRRRRPQRILICVVYLRACVRFYFRPNVFNESLLTRTTYEKRKQTNYIEKSQ